jgi:hemolysin activation/secretion protein
MRARTVLNRRMQTQMTITRTESLAIARWRALAAALVIIAGTTSRAGSPPAAAPVALTTPATLTTALTTVVVEGSSVFGAPRLFGAYDTELGRPITREQASRIVEAIAAMYVTEGYVKPEVAIDGTLAARGVLRVTVYEAQVTHVLIEGDAGSLRDALERVGTRLEKARPLRRDDVPQALRDMRQFAGLAISATTRRDANVRNAFELVVQADFSPVEGVVRMNNRGTDQVGPGFLLGQVFANGLLGRGEKTGLIFAAATNPSEYLGGGLFFDSPLNTRGTRANLLLFASQSAPNESPVNLADEYSRERATVRVSHPLRQDSALSLMASGGFEADDLRIERAGATVREDRLRVAEAALRANWRAGATQFSANLQFRHGLHGFGAGLQTAGSYEDPRRADFFVTLLQTSAYRRFADRWSVRLDTFAQTSGYVLPDSERFKIGGDRLGRGFEVAEIAGDRGLGGKVELRRDLLDTDSFAGRFSTYGFYDIGAAWKRDRPGRDSAATAGLGFALQGAELTGYIELASPLTGPDIEGSRSASVFAELSYRF